MKITAEGWGRRVDTSGLLSGEISDATRMEYGDTLKPDTLYVRYGLDGGVDIMGRSPQRLRLGGRYLVQVELSRADIAHLFYATHAGDIVQVFRKMVEGADDLTIQTPKRTTKRRRKTATG